MSILIKNAHLISPDVDEENAAVLIDGNKIAAVIKAGEPLPKADQILDAKGNMLLPGFIDVHCHGGMGYEATSGIKEALTKIAEGKMHEGVTSFCPTTLTLSEDLLSASMRDIEAYRVAAPFTKVIGTHLEGPYLNRECLGAQNPAFIRKPDINEVKRLNAISPVSIMTYAIEVENAVPFTKQLIDEGIKPSCGHTNATNEQFAEGKKMGLSRLTHFCNQMTKLHHREIGMVGAGLLDDNVSLEMICDKIHLCPDMIRLAFKIKPIQKILLITDAMEATGLPDGDYQLGGLAVIVKDGAARLKSSNALAGSTLQFNIALKNVFEVTGLPLKELVKTTSYNQALDLGLKNLGKIEAQYTADLVILDKNFAVKHVFIDGVQKF